MSEKFNDEVYILACCLQDEGALFKVSSELSPKDFLFPPNKLIYGACIDLINESFKVDVMSIYDRISDGIKDVGGIKYINRVSNIPTTRDNLPGYIKSVKNKSIKAQLKDKLTTVQDKLSDFKGDPVEYCYEQVLDVANSNSNVGAAEHMGSGIHELIEDRAELKGKLPGISTGFPSLDEGILGLQPGRAIIIAARAKAGKSAFLLAVSKNIAINEKRPVLYLDTELPKEFQQLRLLSMLSGVEERKLATGRWVNNRTEVKALSLAAKKIEQGKLYHLYLKTFSYESILSLARQYKIKSNIELLVFDYIKLPDSSDLKSAQEYQHLGYLTNILKNRVAGDLNIPVLTACQLNRTAVGVQKNDESQIGGSDRLAHYCDALVFLREKSESEMYDEGGRLGNMKLRIGINREGASGKGIDIRFQKEILDMKEVGYN